MGAVQVPLADIEDPLTAEGWRVSRPDDEGTLHAEILRELCERSLALHVGGTGTRGVVATLQMVDQVQQQLRLACHDDGIAVARALQSRPVWAAALLRGLRVQFVLAAACAVREGGIVSVATAAGSRRDTFSIQTNWPREIYRTSRRGAPRVVPGAAAASPGAPVLRLRAGHTLAGTRNLRVLDLAELGCAVLLPAGTAPPESGTLLQRVELELDGMHVIVTDARVQHVAAIGRNAHRLGLAWERLPEHGRRALRQWLAETGGEVSGKMSDKASGEATARAAA